MSSWRKPGNGMFDFLSNRYCCNPGKSIMIGDKLTDLRPAAQSNIGRLIHINNCSHAGELVMVKEWAARTKKNVKFLNNLPSTLIPLIS